MPEVNMDRSVYFTGHHRNHHNQCGNMSRREVRQMERLNNDLTETVFDEKEHGCCRILACLAWICSCIAFCCRLFGDNKNTNK